MATLSEEKKQEWQKHIQDYISSGLSLKKYCDQKDLVYHNMRYHWKRYCKHQRQLEPSKKFASVKVASSTQRVEIYFPNGIKCLLPNQFDKIVLQQLVDVFC